MTLSVFETPRPTLRSITAHDTEGLQRTTASLTQPVIIHRRPHRVPPHRRRQKFFPSSPLSAWLSRVRSATRRFSRPFSSSSWMKGLVDGTAVLSPAALPSLFAVLPPGTDRARCRPARGDRAPGLRGGAARAAARGDARSLRHPRRAAHASRPARGPRTGLRRRRVWRVRRLVLRLRPVRDAAPLELLPGDAAPGDGADR